MAVGRFADGREQISLLQSTSLSSRCHHDVSQPRHTVVVNAFVGKDIVHDGFDIGFLQPDVVVKSE